MDELQILKNSKEDLIWVIESLPKLREKFLNKVVAVKNKEIVASSDNMNDLIIEMNRKNIKEGEVIIKKISSGKEIVIY